MFKIINRNPEIKTSNLNIRSTQLSALFEKIFKKIFVFLFIYEMYQLLILPRVLYEKM